MFAWCSLLFFFLSRDNVVRTTTLDTLNVVRPATLDTLNVVRMTTLDTLNVVCNVLDTQQF